MIKTQLTVLLPQKLKKIQLTPPVAELALEYGGWGEAPVSQINISDQKTSTARHCFPLKATKAPIPGKYRLSADNRFKCSTQNSKKNSEGFHMNPAELTKCIHLFAFI